MPTRRTFRYLTGIASILALLAMAPGPAATAQQPAARTAPDSAPDRAPATSATAPAADTWQPPLSTRGRYIVDAKGDRFRLKSANWDGAQGSWTGSGSVDDPANHHSGQNSSGIPLGLDRVPCRRCSPTSTGSASTASGCRSPTR
ncbi:hypothetical protein SVIO_089660 [Streptomyces violaceusniger]|uniref:Uncharacterized protein n=1 Tax=Streptomyces violaceusniger TaxID=68280 RepID=A0A4D4LJV6_STRVO|nr:hypothetical protein SVIO_089660 [Streptomyces violaceusniger]